MGQCCSVSPTHKTETTPLNGPSSPSRHISVFSAWMMLTTWSTSSSNVLYPNVFGVLGVVGGPLMMLGAFFINWKITHWTVTAALETRAETFGDLGFALGGRRGRLLMEGAQLLNQQVFMPVAIVLCVDALQNLAGAGANDGGQGASLFECNGNVALLFSGIAFILVQLSRQVRFSLGNPCFAPHPEAHPHGETEGTPET